jgi:hypothetical protein
VTGGTCCDWWYLIGRFAVVLAVVSVMAVTGQGYWYRKEYEEARDLITKGDFPAGKELLKRLCAKHPALAQPRFLLTHVLLATGALDDAQGQLMLLSQGHTPRKGAHQARVESLKAAVADARALSLKVHPLQRCPNARPHTQLWLLAGGGSAETGTAREGVRADHETPHDMLAGQGSPPLSLTSPNHLLGLGSSSPRGNPGHRAQGEGSQLPIPPECPVPPVAVRVAVVVTVRGLSVQRGAISTCGAPPIAPTAGLCAPPHPLAPWVSAPPRSHEVSMFRSLEFRNSGEGEELPPLPLCVWRGTGDPFRAHMPCIVAVVGPVGRARILTPCRRSY